jgi:hypothetical protein
LIDEIRHSRPRERKKELHVKRWGQENGCYAFSLINDHRIRLLEAT